MQGAKILIADDEEPLREALKLFLTAKGCDITLAENGRKALDELKKTYAGKLQVDFIDVWQNKGAGEQYGIEAIPTQIIFEASGKELYRHTGFYSKEDILAKLKELGVKL